MRNPHPLILCLLAVLLASPVSAQEGHGVVTFLPADYAPVSLLWPVLFAHDPQTGTITSGSAVIPEPPALPTTEQSYTVGADLIWSDGTPITAYDVIYSLLSGEASTSELTGLRIDDEQHFTLAYSSADCVVQSRINSWVISTESHNPDFRRFANWFMAQSDELPAADEWREAFAEWSENADWIQYPDESLSGGPFTVVWDDARGIEYVRQNEIILTTLESSDRHYVERFLHGDANLLLDAPYERRADLRATPGIQLYEAPGYEVDYIVFNQSDPNYPRDAFVDDEPLEQLPHRYFSDVRVRRAIQLAIDVPALIEGALYENATPINGAYSPASWAYNPDLPMPEYDPDAAKRLLDEAGWRDVNGDGFRECYGCLNASPNTPLSIYLGVQSDGIRDRAAEMLRIQLTRVGVDLWVGGGDSAYQDFDMFLTGTTARDPDLYRLFAREWDRLGMSEGNIGSVDHPELEAILDSARKVPGCDMEERAALYAEAQQVLRDDVPAIWLYARHDLYAARGINGFAPLPGEPFWNVSEWIVAR